MKSATVKPVESQNVNSLQKEDSAIHSWYRFVLSFPPHLVQKYLKKFDSDAAEDYVFDPFCGTGTTLVEAKKQGFKVVGCDAHPFAAIVSKVKTTWSLDTGELEEDLRQLQGRLESKAIDLTTTNGAAPSINGYRLSMDEEKILPTGFLSPLPQLKLLMVRDAILKADFKDQHEAFFMVALAHTIANGAGNFAFGPEIYRTKEKTDYRVFEHFTEQAKKMISDLEAIQEAQENEPSSLVVNDDARSLIKVPNDLTRVITSPPYPNEKDYTRTTRVESLLLKVFTDKKQLRQVKESLLRSNTRNIFVKDDDGEEVKEFESIKNICAEIESRRIALNKTSGFEKLYHKVVSHYFGGMRRHFRALKPKLKNGAKLAYVVGDQMSFLMVKVPTAQILAEIAKTEGYTIDGTDLWRERVGTKVRNCPDQQKTVRVREEVLLLSNP